VETTELLDLVLSLPRINYPVAFSSAFVHDYFSRRWEGNPIYPSDVRWIKAPWDEE